mmetsp:Transcript_31527/g.55862  ORF Transcript_31527/g.55862 Transcript_31527/m.55862 type:complete len:87 (-) Transcript_31527:454-714(-)
MQATRPLPCAASLSHASVHVVTCSKTMNYMMKSHALHSQRHDEVCGTSTLDPAHCRTFEFWPLTQFKHPEPHHEPQKQAHLQLAAP